MPLYLGDKEVNIAGLGDVTNITAVGNPGLNIDFIIIAGGGGGGRGGAGGGTRFNGAGGGGGAGGLISGSTTLYKGVYQVIVGDGGDAGSVSKATNGETSSFLGLTAIGGGAGGDAGDRDIPNCSIGSGSDGGSGGGGGTWTTLWGCDTSEGVAGQGFAGATAGGGGGAAGSPNPTTDGGPGVTWVSGSTIYARGGFLGGSTIQNVTYGSGGRGANAFLLPYAFADPGIEGVVIIRYPGPQRASGGSIIVTETDGYTYHTFLNGPFQDTFDYV